MRIDILTAVPEQFRSPVETSILKRAVAKGLVSIHIHDLREFGFGNYRQIDDSPYGGGAGMVLMVEPIAAAIRKLQSERKYEEVIYFSPDGVKLNQAVCNKLSMKENLLLIAGHYKGVDQRVRDLFVTQEISIGDYVLSGGELPALVLTDAIVRLIPGVLGDETSALSDSFQDQILEPPIYTRPADFEGNTVPPILLSGNFMEIEKWRDQEAEEKTRKLRPDLLDLDEGGKE